MKLFLLLGLLVLNFAHAAALEGGTYSGMDSGRSDFKLHVKPVPGRTGSFMGILMAESQVRVYLIDQFSSNKYGMLSLRPKENFVFGVVSTNPTLAMTITDDTIVLAPNHNNVDISFQTSITFKRKSKKTLQWLSLAGDNYASKKLVVSSLDANNEASVISKVDGLAGDFVLRETRPDLYLMLESVLVSTGVKLSSQANHFVFFQKKEIVVVEGKSGAFKVYRNGSFF